MPNAARTHTGSSLGRRVSAAAQLTREQQAQRDSAAEQRREEKRARKRTVTQRSRSEARTQKSGARAENGERRRSGTKAAPSRNAGKADASARAGSKNERGTKQQATPRKHHRALRIAAGAGVFIVLCGFALYPVAQPYYAALRDGQRSEAQIQAVTVRNEALAASTEALQTDEGIETQARLAYGYVMEGESSVVVTNVDSTSTSDVPSEVDVDEITAPSTWYYDILDDVFSYESS